MLRVFGLAEEIHLCFKIFAYHSLKFTRKYLTLNDCFFRSFNLDLFCSWFSLLLFLLCARRFSCLVWHQSIFILISLTSFKTVNKTKGIEMCCERLRIINFSFFFIVLCCKYKFPETKSNECEVSKFEMELPVLF